MNPTLIPLGYHCNITFLMQDLKIKTETGLFEWIESKRLQYITDVINIIKLQIDTDIIKVGINCIYILNEYLYTYHYSIEEYKSIFVRRAKRFLELIQNSSEVIFVRINTHIAEDTSAEEINNFARAIQSINPDLNIKFLLINTIFDEYIQINPFDLISGIELIQKYIYYKDCKNDIYLRNNKKIQNIFSNYMHQVGYNSNVKTNREFSDKD